MASHLTNRLSSDPQLPMPVKAVALDRRKRARALVHWPLSFSRSDTEIVQTVTRDLSSDGLYCVTNAILVPGETIVCTLAVPTHYPHGGNSALPVLCKVRVVRVEVTGEGGFYGVGCQITDYRVVNSCP